MKVFLTLFFLMGALFASEITLKDKLSDAKVGSYLVMEQNKNFTFLRIYDKKGERIALEEVSISLEAFKRNGLSFREWFEKGAPGHTAWTVSQINLRTGQVEETYSFAHNGWLEGGSGNAFMMTLLNLHFHLVPDSERRHVGLPPGYGKPDHRPLWHPRLIVGGTIVGHVSFAAWKARWPADGSELARKVVEVYLPESAHDAYPSYFPYWLEVEGKLGSAKIRVIDSGMESNSPQTRFPHRKPTAQKPGRWEQENYVIELQNPSHFTEFMVMAEESDSLFGKTFPIPCEVKYSENVTHLLLKKEDLSKVLTPGESYRFLITPQDDPFASTETKHNLIYK